MNKQLMHMLKRVILKLLEDNQVMRDHNKQQKIKNHMLGDIKCYCLPIFLLVKPALFFLGE